jgi:hypothetical protein
MKEHTDADDKVVKVEQVQPRPAVLNSRKIGNLGHQGKPESSSAESFLSRRYDHSMNRG